MAHPMVVCLERLALGVDRYVRCTAQVGRQAGLSVSAQGEILWLSETPGALALWVTRDGRLMAERTDGDSNVSLHRGGRSLDLPTGQRGVIVLHLDQLVVGDARFTVHLHGSTPQPFAPQRLRGAAQAAGIMGVTASLLASCGMRTELEGEAAGGGGGAGGAGSTQPNSTTELIQNVGGSNAIILPDTAGAGGAIEVRDFPPM